MSGDRAQPVVRPLTAADERSLTGFPCASYREPWTVVVQDMVREQLVGSLAIGDVFAVGAWIDDELCGVAAWRIDDDLCRSVVLAVRPDRRRCGLGGLLKDTVVDAARVVGATAVVSYVHWDNEAMIELNAARGANVERIPGDEDYCLCVIPLRP